MIDISVHTNADLSRWTNHLSTAEWPVLPISPQRALSYLHNPHAQPDDKVLYLAWEKRQLVGYRLVLPDKMQTPDGWQQVGWFSCVWVDPKRRGKGIAKAMVDRAMEDWHGRVLYQNPAVASHQLYQKTGAFATQTCSGYRWYHRIDTAWMLQRMGRTVAPNLWTKTTDAIGNALLWPVRHWNKKMASADVRWEIRQQWDDETLKHLQSSEQDKLFPKSTALWQWRQHYPWILEQPANDMVQARYYFSATAERYRHFWLQLYTPQGEWCGAMVARLWNNDISVLHFWGNEHALPPAHQWLQHIIRHLAITTLTVFHSQLILYLQRHHRGHLHHKTIDRLFNYPAAWQSWIEANGHCFTPGDGDGYFT